MRIFNLIIALLLISASVTAQSQTVSFIHGFEGNPQIWDNMDDDLQEDFDYSKYVVSYNQYQSISSSASSVSVPQSVAVAYSQGGLLAREYLKQNATSDLDALITVGTPHLGAPVISNAQAGNMQDYVDLWIEDLKQGPKVLWGETTGYDIAVTVLELANIIGGNALKSYIEILEQSTASLTQMKPNSSFLNTLNSSPNSTLPSARYAIYGAEDRYGYVRIGDSFLNSILNSNTMESGDGINAHTYISALWLYATVSSQTVALYYLWLYNDSDTSHPNHFYYYDQYVLYQTAATGFAWGFLSLRVFQHLEFEEFIVGGERDGQKLDESDALITAKRQAPGFIQNLRAEGVNHLEATRHPNTKDQIVFAFNDIGVPTPPPPPPPPSVSISGPSNMMSGTTDTFTANVSDGAPPISYQWYYKHDSDPSWTLASGETSSTYDHTAGSQPGEYVRVVVTDSNNDSDEDQHYFTITGMGF